MYALFFFLSIYLFSLLLWLHWVFVAVRGLVSSCGVQVFSLQLWRTGLAVPRHVGSQFPDQGSNPRPRHWKVDSLPLDHQGSPYVCSLTGAMGILSLRILSTEHMKREAQLGWPRSFPLLDYKILVLCLLVQLCRQ